MMWYWGTGVHGWAWGLGIFTSLIFWGLIIWAVVALVGWARPGRPGSAAPGIWRESGSWPGAGPPGSPGPHGPGSPGPHGPGSPWRDNDPEEILSRRYAAGEIGVEEYRQRLEVLRAQRHTADTGSGTRTATAPDGRTLHSHGPPQQAA